MNKFSLLSPIFILLTTFVVPAAFADELGISKTEILVGSPQPLSGPGASKKTAANLVYGTEAYFKKVNAEGGINGRKIRYLVRDSENDGAKALEITRKMVEEDKIFAVVSPMTTPAMVAIRAYVTKLNLPVVAPSDGDSRYRVPPSPSIFYIRTSFEQEAAATLDLIKRMYGVSDFSLYRSSSALGEAMKTQYMKGSHAKDMKILALGIEGDNYGDVSEAVKVIAASHAKVVVMSGNPVANSKFLTAALAAGIQANWIANSPGMSPDFYLGIGSKPESVIMSSVVPLDASKYPIVKEYEEQMKKENHEIEPLSLEGYLGAALFCEGLKRAGQDPTRLSYIAALNTLKNFSLGGVQLSYSETDHAGLHEVFFFKTVKGGGYTPLIETSAK